MKIRCPKCYAELTIKRARGTLPRHHAAGLADKRWAKTGRDETIMIEVRLVCPYSGALVGFP